MIKTLLFDVGDVLVHLNWAQGFLQLRGQFFDARDQEMDDDAIMALLYPGLNFELWEALGTNHTTADEFLSRVAVQAGYMGPRDLLHRALVDIFAPMPERIALFNKLIADGRYQVALVSDTNCLHVAQLEATIPEIYQAIPTERRFYSHDVGCQKKNGPDIYRHVCDALHIKPEETLMIDDRIQNKPGADAIGLNFLQVLPSEDLAAHLTALGLVV